MKNGTQPAPASRKATHNPGWRSKTPHETIAVIAVIWSNGKLMQCTWM